MFVTFEELRNSGNLLLEEKYLFYKINRIFTEGKYKGLYRKIDSLWYDYFDKIEEYRILYNPGIEPRFRVYCYKNNYWFVWLHLEIFKNRQINAYFDVDDHELAKNPFILKNFQIELCERLGFVLQIPEKYNKCI
jgi:hypothetical protein